MIKKLALIICSVMIILQLGACQLAREDGGGAGENDRMIGVFVTQEHLDLFDFESYFNDNVSSILMDGEVKIGVDSEKYNGRIYATQKRETITNEDGETHESVDYVFEGVEGVPFFLAKIAYGDGQSYLSSYASEAMHDVQVTTGDKTILEGTIYVIPKNAGALISMYVNPVYQNADGEVYLMAGTGMSFSGDLSEGMGASQTITESDKITFENGEIVEHSFEAKIKMAVRYPATSVTIIEMGKDSEVLNSQEFSINALPGEYSPKSDTEFIIIEECTNSPTGESIKRQILQSDSNSFIVLIAGDGGLCEGRYIELLWEE